MTDKGLPVGQLFSHVYLTGGTLLRDKETFRRRLGFYCQKNFRDVNSSLGNFLRQETGLLIAPNGLGGYLFEHYFNEIEIRYVLNTITLIWRFHDIYQTSYTSRQSAEAWRNFAARVLHEEGMGYQLDERCGVHFFVDEAFEGSRQSLIPMLGQARYAGVLAAFEGAYGALDSEPQDTKQADI